MKTSQEIMEIGIEESRKEEETMQYSEFFRKKWYSEEELRLKLLDMYRFMCNEYGKANIWSMDPDELLENVDLLIEKKLFNASDLNSRSSDEDSLNKGYEVKK